MTIELINSLSDSALPGVSWQIEQVRTGKSSELWVATPHEDASYLARQLGLAPYQVFDIYAQRYLTAIDETKGIWWTDLPVPNNARFVINADWTKSIMSLGCEIAKVRWYSDAKRIVQAVAWQDSRGQIDYKDIYQRDGKRFATQYFSDGQLLVTEFFFGDEAIVVRDFYFNKRRDFVYANGQQFESAEQYIAAVINRQTNQTINITQFGRELTFVPKHTILTLIDNLTDSASNLQPRLRQILTDHQSPIGEIRMKDANFDYLKRAGLPTNHVKLVRI